MKYLLELDEDDAAALTRVVDSLEMTRADALRHLIRDAAQNLDRPNHTVMVQAELQMVREQLLDARILAAQILQLTDQQPLA